MKNTHVFLTTLIALVIATACSSKKEDASTVIKQEATSDEWPEMDAYHMIMAEAFHPYKDSANLEPVKTQASELVKAAEAWAAAPLPEKVNNDEVKSKLQDLKTSSETLAQLTTSGTDEEIGASLTSLHDKFHALQEAWYGGEGHKHEH